MANSQHLVTQPDLLFYQDLPVERNRQGMVAVLLNKGVPTKRHSKYAINLKKKKKSVRK